jgi:hypothetical protein
MGRPRTAIRVAGAAALALLVAATGCTRSAPNATAEGAVREFVEQSAVYGGNPAHARALFQLLSARGRENLQGRAERYGAATGRTIEPSAMIVPSRATLRFAPRSYRATVTGDHAMVEVRGAGPSDVAYIPCVLEEGLWQIDLLLPDLPPLRKRASEEP